MYPVRVLTLPITCTKGGNISAPQEKQILVED